MKFYVGGKPHVSGIKYLIDNLLNMPHEELSCIIHIDFYSQDIVEQRQSDSSNMDIQFNQSCLR